jgi:hypothetical protein
MHPLPGNWISLIRLFLPTPTIYRAIAAAIFGEGGNETDAERQRAWLEKMCRIW